MSPPRSINSPPDPESPLPTVKVIAPPLPDVAAPDPMEIDPLFPLEAVPELKDKSPLIPDIPAFGVLIKRIPVDDEVDSPDAIAIFPPV